MRSEKTIRSVALLVALAAAPLATAGCGTTKAATSPPVEAEARPLTAPADSVDHALVREAERWMVEQAKRRAASQPAQPAALPAPGR